jgi:translocation and assembly module TamB
MLWRRIKKTLLYTLAFLFILLASLVALIETNAGSRWVVTKLANYAGIQLGDLQGNLRQGLDVAWIEYSTATETFRADNVSFRWNATALLYTAVSIESLSVDNISIQLPESASSDPKPFSNWLNIDLPVRLELKKFQLNNIQFSQGQYQDQWQEFSGSLSLGNFHLRYSPLRLRHENYQLKLSGKSDLSFPYKTDATLEWQFNADTEYQGRSDIKGDIYRLVTQTEFKTPFIANANLTIPLVDKQKVLQTIPQFELNATAEKQLFPEIWWMQDQPLPELAFRLNFTGNWQGYQGSLSGDWSQAGLPPVNLSLKAKGDWQKVSIDELRLLERRDAAYESENPLSDLLVAGQVDWLPDLRWDLAIQTDFFDAGLIAENWPTRLKGKFHSDGIKGENNWLWKVDQLDFAGSVRDLAFSLNGNLYQDESRWQSEKLQLVWGANRFDVKGFLSKSNQADSKVEWNLQAPMLGQLNDELSGSFSSRGVLSGSWMLPQLTADAKADSVSWQDIALKNLQLSIKPLDISQYLHIEENENTNKNYRDLILEQQYQLTFLAEQLQLAGQSFKSIQIKGDGSFRDHKLTSNIRHSRLGRVDVELAGKLKDAEWQGDLQKFSTKIKNVPKWWLSVSRPISVSYDQIDVQPLCFTTRSNQTAIIDAATQVVEDGAAYKPFYPNASSVRVKNNLWGKINPERSPITVLPAPELCLDFYWQAEKGMQLGADLHAVPLRQFYAAFKPEVFFAGVMNGYFRLHTANADLTSTQAIFYMETRDAELRYQYEGGVTDVYPWKFASVSAHLDQSQLKSNIDMDWSGYGDLKASAHVALDKQQIVQASFDTAFHNLQPLETLLPFMDDVKGRLSSSLKASGNLQQPNVSGFVRLDEASTKIPKLGLTLSNISSSIIANDLNQLSLMASATSGKGQLNLQGALVNPLQNDWRLVADLNGQDFQIMNLLSMKANINPAIHLDANSQLIKLTGEAEVPYLRANIKTIPQSSVTLSEDVVLVNEKATVSSRSTPVQANLRLSLGKDVQFKGFGLESQLEGNLKLNKEPQRPWVTNGFVAVKEGSYQAYGQALTIERGQLIFQGDYENPGLDIRATRVIDDDENTKVGLEISGSLQRPRAKVYSQPAHSESDAMMMLLTGKPLSEASKADASMLLAALGGLGVERSQMITQDVAQFFGVDELAIKSDKGIDQSQLWVGKYLTPKILVRYVVGLFDQAFSLGVVYRLTDKIRIEAESGETQSLDVIYKIER